MHYCLGSSRGNRGHAGEKKIFSGSIAHALHYITLNGSWLHARLPYARHFESQATVKESTHPRMLHLPGTLEERQLTERSLNPSHPCSFKQKIPRGPVSNSLSQSHSRVSPDRIKLPAWNIPIGRAIL